MASAIFAVGRRMIWAALLASLFLQGCTRRSDLSAQQQQALIASTVGDWQDIYDARSVMHFKADGSMMMNSVAENRACTYSFPDSKHIRLDCMYAQGTRYTQDYGFVLEDDKMKINDGHETGIYQKK